MTATPDIPVIAVARRTATDDLSRLIHEIMPLINASMSRGVETRVVHGSCLQGSGFCTRPAAIQQILLNLAMNADAAMPHGGDLLIETRREPDSIRIIVADTGTGLSDDALQRIFEPFYTTRPSWGLGLCIVRTLIDELGGTIRVHSEMGHGTTFQIDLPV